MQSPPEPYDGHLKPFGSDLKNRMTLGGKYEFKVNDVPPPGYYNPERADSIVKKNSRQTTLIHNSTMSSSMIKRDVSPGPGEYEGDYIGKFKIPGGPYISPSDDFENRQINL